MADFICSIVININHNFIINCASISEYNNTPTMLNFLYIGWKICISICWRFKIYWQTFVLDNTWFAWVLTVSTNSDRWGMFRPVFYSLPNDLIPLLLGVNIHLVYLKGCAPDNAGSTDLFTPQKKLLNLLYYHFRIKLVWLQHMKIIARLNNLCFCQLCKGIVTQGQWESA